MTSHHPAAWTSGAIDDTLVLSLARSLLDLQRSRRILGAKLFTDPAWEILLDLYISNHEGRRLSVSAVCVGTSSSSATALRYLAMLQDQLLVSRTRDENDGRRSYIELTPLGQTRLRQLLSRYVGEELK